MAVDVRAFEISLGERLRDLSVHGEPTATTTATTVPTDIYTDAERHHRELAAMARYPAAAVAASEVADRGSFVTLRLGATPVIVTRDGEGDLHALVNACAHRGATVEPRPGGHARLFSCRFHGWSYALDGALRSVSDRDRFSTQPCEGGLARLACEERHGIVWVTADPRAPALAVRDWLGEPLDDLLTGLGLADMVAHAAADHDTACNWKMLTDGFLELYHLKYLHRNSIAPYFPGTFTALDGYGPHFVTALPKNRLLRQLTESPVEEWRVLDGATMAIVLMPGTVIQWQAGHVELFSLRPDPAAPGRVNGRLTMMVPADRAHETELWDRNWERVVATIPGEDWAVAVEVQRNIEAGAVAHLRVGANEYLLLDHLAAVDTLLAPTT